MTTKTEEQLAADLSVAQQTINAYEALVEELTSDDEVRSLVQQGQLHRRNRIARAQNSLTLNLDELVSSTGIFFSDFEEFDPVAQRSFLRLLKNFHDLVVTSFDQRNLPL